VDVDTFSVAVEPGDLFLLCSDGLTSMIDDQTILGAVEQNRGSLEEAAKALVNAANRGGGEDNITVIFFEVAGGEEPAEETVDTVRTTSLPDEDTMDENDGQPPVAVTEPKPEQERRGRVLPFFGALAVLLFIAAAILWLLGQS
jgi:Stage II sporulation protein E (SpoIIE)